jgi:prepilin-type N-terminal cleavage/methylation domain-containing protein
VKTRGFTLIELLLVVAILSATALAAFGLVSEDRAQIRIDDTRNRLNILRRAIVGIDGPAYGGEVRLSGFVADNGRLPASIAELRSNNLESSPMLSQLARSVKFSGNTDTTCVQTGTLDDVGPAAAAITLTKGHRGDYLSGASGAFRDGWGNVGTETDISETSTFDETDDVNFGWTFMPGPPLQIASNGLDNLPDGEKDARTTIAEADWTVDLTGWKVTIRNRTSASLSALSDLQAALLVFRNTGTNGEWLRYSSGKCDTDIAVDESCIVTFPGPGACPGVPIGRHLLVLLSASGVYPSSTAPVTVPLDFFPGVQLPNATLEVRP